MKKIILASKSIDRSELLKKAGIPFEKSVTNIDEEKYKAKYSHGNDLVKELAKVKALFAKNKLIKSELDALIVAADSLVILEGEIIGKAQTEEEAFKIIKKLTGRTHELITGIAITETNNPKIVIDSDTTFVQFLKLSDEEIIQYIKTDEWKGRAGAYSINDKASLFIKKINGSSSNVIGLPMHKLYKILRTEFGLNLFHIERA
ncbi:MAG: septum formation protein Maf [Promethearchaeota archaeon Loki_b32]|nr:MAG: septum formation protein Maf [Candidatus Lokiarchaeota archaeon Loki_b32]